MTLLASMTTISPAQETSAPGLKSACVAPHQDAAIVGMPEVYTPSDAAGVSGTSIVQVGLTSSGAVSDIRIAQSSDNFWLDTAALKAARFFKYQPEKDNCRGIPGSYLVYFTF